VYAWKSHPCNIYGTTFTTVRQVVYSKTKIFAPTVGQVTRFSEKPNF